MSYQEKQDTKTRHDFIAKSLSNKVEISPEFLCLVFLNNSNLEFIFDNDIRNLFRLIFDQIVCVNDTHSVFLVINDDAGETEATAVQEDEMTDPGKIIRWAGINHFFKSSIFQ